MARIHDVVVVGAGPAGSATAADLAKHGLDVLLLDKAKFPRDKTCGDALTPRAVRELNHLGALRKVEPLAQRVDAARIVGPNHRAIRAPLPSGQRSPHYMLVVRRFLLDDLLRQHAVACGARFEDDVNVIAFTTRSAEIELTAERTGRRRAIRARTVVVAVGANTGLLRRIGLLEEVPQMTLAARGYFDLDADLTQELEFHFLESDLPGYAWIFPLVGQQANIGAGMIDSNRNRPGNRRTAPAMLKEFLQMPKQIERLAGARADGPLKGYPIRTDFGRTRCFGERMLLVGEAAGLVNPLTGEGIDYALESARLAAKHLVASFASGSFGWAALSAYERALHHEYAGLFAFSRRVRRYASWAPVMNGLVLGARLRPGLRDAFTEIMMGHIEEGGRALVGRLARAALGI